MRDGVREGQPSAGRKQRSCIEVACSDARSGNCEVSRISDVGSAGELSRKGTCTHDGHGSSGNQCDGSSGGTRESCGDHGLYSFSGAGDDLGQSNPTDGTVDDDRSGRSNSAGDADEPSKTWFDAVIETQDCPGGVCPVPWASTKTIEEKPKVNDQVYNPSHYVQGPIECIEALEAALTEEEFQGFCKANVIKYLWRMNHKGDRLKDAQKARWYLNRLIGSLDGGLD